MNHNSAHAQTIVGDSPVAAGNFLKVIPMAAVNPARTSRTGFLATIERYSHAAYDFGNNKRYPWYVQGRDEISMRS